MQATVSKKSTKETKPKTKKNVGNTVIFLILCALVVVFLAPILFIVINSFKGKFFISDNPFALPTSQTFVGLSNYINGLEKTGFLSAIGWSFFITIGSVAVILFFTSMTAYYITRVKSKFTSVLYYLFVFSMVVPFQMVMFTLSNTADSLGLNTPWTIPVIYLGFGAGMAVFMFTGFIKGLPLEIEEAAAIDGCGPIRTFFIVIVPMLKPTLISVGILEIMWIWNDYLLPYLVLDLDQYRTIPIHIQYLQGSYGSVDLGAIMALIILSIIPVIFFYLTCQKHIIKGVAAGAVKG